MNNPAEIKHPRAIRSFVRREGRMTVKQEWALTHLWPLYGLEVPIDGGLFNFAELFHNANPVVVEIGFGDGASLLEMAKQQPQVNFIGIEVYRNGVGALLSGIHAEGLKNLKVLVGDAVEIFKQHIPQHVLRGVQLFFPDPWPKKRHHKRRIVQPEFVDNLADKLAIGGYFHLATDWENYAEHMLEVLLQFPKLQNTVSQGYVPRPDARPMTKFEKRGHRLGHGVWDLIFSRIDSKA